MYELLDQFRNQNYLCLSSAVYFLSVGINFVQLAETLRY